MVEAANFGRTSVKYYPPSTTETCFGINESIDLKAMPNSGYRFSRWSISGGTSYSGSTNPYGIKMPASSSISTTVIAYFTGGSPPPPTLTSDAGEDQTVNEGDVVTLDGSGSAVSSGEITDYLWKQVGGTTVTLSDASSFNPSFTAPNVDNDGDTLIFELTVTSDQNDTDTDTVSIFVKWKRNDTLKAGAGLDQSVRAGEIVTLDGSGSVDLESHITDYEWKVEDSSIVTSDIVLGTPHGETTTFTAPDAKGWVNFSLTVTNADGDKAFDTIMVLIGQPSQSTAFSAYAGPDQVVSSGSEVQLSGSETLPVGTSILGYQWNKLSGPVVMLSGSDPMSPSVTTEKNPAFIAPEFEEGQKTLTFQFTAKTVSGLTDVDEMLVTVSSQAYILGNMPPTAEAGEPQTVVPGTIAILDASNSQDPEGKPLLYHWAATSGPEITLSDPYAPKPTFVVPLTTGSAIFELTVTDDAIKTDTDTVEIAWSNSAPIADAGPDQEVFEGDLVALTGSGSSDPDDLIASYQWVQKSGPAVTISNPAGADAIFAAPTVTGEPVLLTFELTVTDHAGQASTDEVAIMVKNKNAAPIADAGADKQVDETATVVLRGFGSDPDGDTVFYQWAQISGPPVTLQPGSALNSESVTFVAPNVSPNYTPAHVIFELTVTDSEGLSDSDRIEILVNEVGLTPVANAGNDQTAYANTVVTLDGSNSKGMDNKAISGYWTQIGGQTAVLSNVSSLTPTFQAPAVSGEPLTLVFQLTVRDSQGLTAYDEVTVTVQPATGAPVANAGPDQSVEEGATVTLDGSGSSDPDDGIKNHLWEQTEGDGVVLSDATAVQPVFAAPKISEKTVVLKFRLTVEDYNGMKNSAIVTITVNNKSGGGGGGCFISSMTD